MPYAAAAELLADVLPIDCGANATTIRQLRAARRIELELTEERVSFMQDACPRDWMNLPLPDGRIVIGLDDGYIRDRNDRKKNFELIVGRSLSEDGDPRYIGFVHGYDRKPQRRILDHLKRQGVQANQDITFITEVRSLAEMIAPASEHCPRLVSYHHAHHRPSPVRAGLENYDEQAGQDLLEALRRIKWHLWHGNVYRARDEIADLQFDAESLGTDYPNMRKFLTAIGDVRAYIAPTVRALSITASAIGPVSASPRPSSRPPSTPSSPSASPRNSRCSGARSARIFCCKPARRPLTVPSARPSGNGTLAWPTTITSREKRPAPHDRPTNPHAPLKAAPERLAETLTKTADLPLCRPTAGSAPPSTHKPVTA